MLQTKDVTKKLGINRDRIKYFKRQGVFIQENPAEGFTDKDIYNLERLVVLTKAGLTCDDIIEIQNGKCSLSEAFVSRRKKLEDKIKQMEGSLKLSSEMLSEEVQYESLSTDYYLDVIRKREEAGEEFMDIDEDYFQLSLNRKIRCPQCQSEYDIDLGDYITGEYSSSDRRDDDMGPDNYYQFDTEDNYKCPCCGKKLQVTGWIREYPISSVDSEHIDISLVEEA